MLLPVPASSVSGFRFFVLFFFLRNITKYCEFFPISPISRHHWSFNLVPRVSILPAISDRRRETLGTRLLSVVGPLAFHLLYSGVPSPNARAIVDFVIATMRELSNSQWSRMTRKRISEGNFLNVGSLRSDMTGDPRGLTTRITYTYRILTYFRENRKREI